MFRTECRRVLRVHERIRRQWYGAGRAARCRVPNDLPRWLWTELGHAGMRDESGAGANRNRVRWQ